MSKKNIIPIKKVELLPEVSGAVLPDSADRVNNQLQKERAAYQLGLTRSKYIKVINEMLEAGEVSRSYDKERGWVEEFVPDMDRRAKGAELAGKFFGDYKEHAAAVTVTHNKVVYQWLSAPNAGVIANRV